MMSRECFEKKGSNKTDSWNEAKRAPKTETIGYYQEKPHAPQGDKEND